MIFTLIRINITGIFSRSFRNFRRSNKRSKVSLVLIGLLVIYVVGAIMFGMGAMLYSFSSAFFGAGIGWFYFALVGLIIFALCFIGGIFMVQTQIFNAKDNDLLLSMPIKPSAILGGRLAALLIFEYVYELLILVPAIVVLFITGDISLIPAAGFIFLVASAILLPLFAVALGSLFGWLIALASSRLRRKNIVTLVFSLAFLGLYFWGYSKVMGYMNTLLLNGAEIADAVRRAVFPAYHLGAAIADGNAMSFLIFAVCAIIPFAIMYFLLSISFVKITTTKRGAKRVVYHEKETHAAGAKTALLRRELKHYWSSPMYIMNTSLGAVCAIALAAVLAVKPSLITGMFSDNNPVLAGLNAAVAIIVVLTFVSAMNFVSAPSISLEGKKLWIIRSLPVSSREILFSKVLLHLVICATPSLLAGLICIAVIPVSVLQAIIVLITPASVTLLFALLGVVLNLAFPRFDWINEVQPVKQSASCMLSMFGGMALIIALALVYVLLLNSVLLPEYYLLICTAVFVTLSAALYAYLSGAGARKFETL